MQFVRTSSRVLASALRPTAIKHTGICLTPARSFIASSKTQWTARVGPAAKRPLTGPYQTLFSNRFSSTVSVSQVQKAANVATEVIATKPIVGYWLYFNAGLVFAIVVVGGLTRLTESGLSITEWNVISGMKPPRSQQDWEEEFEKYKQFPEYKLLVSRRRDVDDLFFQPMANSFHNTNCRLNRHMTLDEFKSIFYWEWSHRMLGRFIGAAFIIPGMYFASRGQMTKKVARQTLGITAMLGFQVIKNWDQGQWLDSRI